MIKPVLFIVILLLMVPVVYVLFFTKILDRVIGRLRSGDPARQVSGAGKIIDATVVSETDDFEMHRAKSPLSPESRDPKAYPWLIRHRNDESLFWSSARGWVSRELADRFGEDEHLTMVLSPDGSWFKSTE